MDVRNTSSSPEKRMGLVDRTDGSLVGFEGVRLTRQILTDWNETATVCRTALDRFN